MPKSKEMLYSKNLIRRAEEKINESYRLQMQLASVQSFMETENVRTQKLCCPHYNASISDLKRVQSRIRKWRSKLELVIKQEEIKIKNQLITIKEAQNEQE